jgi:NADPH-dependent ferric siderophore reductase
MKKQAIVLAVRTWEPGTVLEADLHLPDCDMSRWDSAVHLECKVGRLTYRDYTPLGWDAGTRTCSLLIHAGHDGPGSRWARGLKAGDVIVYRGVESSHHVPAAGREMAFLGDETSIGHFLALRQLAGDGVRITGAIALTEPHHLEEFGAYFPGWGVQAVLKRTAEDYAALGQWVESLSVSDHTDTVFYLAGHVPAVSGLRKLLRQKGYRREQVRVKGFWG